MSSARLHAWLLGLMLFSLPLSRSITAIFFGVWVFHALVRGQWSFKRTTRLRVLLLLVSYYLLLVLGGLWTSQYGEYRADLWTSLPLLLGPAAMYLGPTLPRSTWALLLRVFAAGTLLAVLICLGTAIWIYAQTGATEQFFYHPFTNPVGIHSIYLACYVGFAILLLAYQLFIDTPNLSRWWLLVVAGLMVGLLLLSARMLLVATTLGIAVLLFGWLQKRYGGLRALTAFALVLLTAVALVSAVPYTRGRFQQVLQADWREAYRENYHNELDPAWHNDWILRLIVWRLVWEQTEGQRLWGVGTGDTQFELRKGWKRIELDEAFSGLNPHNQFLQAYLALGFIGMGVLITTLGVPAVLAVRQKEPLIFAYVLFITAAFMTESYLIRQHGAMFHGTLYSLLVLGILLPKEGP